MTPPKTRSISKNLTISLVATIVVLSLAFILLNYYLISEREKTWLQNKADENIRTIASTLKVPLWDIDRENIKTICTYYFNNDLIAVVKLTGVSGEVFYEKSKTARMDGEQLVGRSSEIYYDDELIGTIQIKMAPQRSQSFNRQLLIALIIGLLISVLGLVFSTGILVKKFLKKPLNYLGTLADSYSKGDYRPPLQDTRYSEFESLVNVFLDMGEKIESQMAELREAEKTLKGHSDQLEKMVARRTAELEAANKNLKNEIQDHRRTEDALSEREQRLQAILAASPGPMVMYDTAGTPVYLNNAFTEVFGWTLEELKGRQIPFVPEDQKTLTTGAITSLYEFGGTKSFEARRYTKDKQILDVVISAALIYGPDEQPTGMIVNLTDISKSKQMENALRDSEEKYRTLFEYSEDALFLGKVTEKGVVLADCNSRACEMFKCPRDLFIGKTPDEISPERQPDGSRGMDGAAPYIRAALKGRPQHFYWKHQKVDGETFDTEMTLNRLEIGNETYLQGIIRDVSDKIKTEKEKQKLQNQLQHAQKMEAIGTLAGGIAHDFNNLLMGIQGRASLMELEAGASPSQRDHIAAIEKYVQSATSLTEQLLGFARAGKYDVNPIDINELVFSTIEMFSRTCKDLRIHTKARSEPAVADVDKRQIEQVMLNLFINAWQAMPEGGDIFVKLSSENLNKEDCQPYNVRAGRFVRISVADTGIGMDEATRHRIFDPFFTTKEKGRGTGLGLASAYGIIKNHGGFITVHSEPGRGSTFDIYLPRSEMAAKQDIETMPSLKRGSETILLVDDEEIIIEVGKELLERLGYRVVVARGGHEAVAAIQQEDIDTDMVILDLVMPDMDGVKTFDLLRELKPKIPILLSSGYSLDGQAPDLMNRGGSGFIQKPFTIANLSLKIREVLDGANEPGTD
jgi:PAS domain S-box-containing protein